MNDIKETKIILKKRKYTGDYTVSSVFIDNIEIIVKQLSNNINKDDGIVVLTIEKKFCCDEKIGTSTLAGIKTEIPFIIKYEKLIQFNEIIDKIKSNNDYKYNNSHYTKEKFDPNRFNYLDLIIDNEQFEIHNNDVLYKRLFEDILEIEHFNKTINEDYQNIKDKIIKKEDNLKDYLIIIDKKIEEIENEINSISNESNRNKSDLEHTVDNLHNMINELDNYNLDMKNNNYQTTGDTSKLQIEDIKAKAKRMYKEIDPKINEIAKEYLEEWRKLQDTINKTTGNFISKIHHLTDCKINEEVLKCENLNSNTIFSILNINDKYVSDLMSMLITIGHHRNIYDNTINRVIPEIAKQIELKTHENGVINYVYSNLYDKLSNEEITKIIEEVTQKKEIDKMNIDEIKRILKKEAIIFNTGGIMPTNKLGESWIGKVCWQCPDETTPIGISGNKMIPIATIFIEGLDYIPKALENIKLLTIFMDEDIWNNIDAEDYDKWFKINTYNELEKLIPCNYVSDNIKPFPLVPTFVNNDFPMWDDVDWDLCELICKMEKNNGISYYDDIYEENHSKHKIGGHPSSIQGGVAFDDGYEYVMQITSDNKANFNIIDSGNFYFGYNPSLNSWSIKCDFY